MQEVSRGGRTVLFVSHAMSAVASLCDRVILLAKGSVELAGATTDVIALHVRSPGGATFVAKATIGSGETNKILRAWLADPASDSKSALSQLQSGQAIDLCVEVQVVGTKPPYIIASFWDELRRPLWEVNSSDYELPRESISQLRLRMRLPRLATSAVSIDLAIGSSHSFDDHIEEAISCGVNTNLAHKGGGQHFPLALDVSIEVL